MSTNEKIHKILEYVCSVPKQDSFTTDQIAMAVEMPIAETNALVKQIFENGDAKHFTTKDISAEGAVGLLRISETIGAFETKKYLNRTAQVAKRYNVYIETQGSGFNILNITFSNLKKVIAAYSKGKASFTIAGQRYFIDNLFRIKIFTYEEQVDFDAFKIECERNDSWLNNIMGVYFTPQALQSIGKDVTEEYIGNLEFGELAEKAGAEKAKGAFVNISRIEELKSINGRFDLCKLVRLCEELNDNFKRGNYLSVGMIGRAILDHVPPIFGFTTFNEVGNNYKSGSKSFKKAMEHLNRSLRYIADSYLHQTIRDREILSNDTQVNFSQDLDCLLGEIVRVLK